MHYNNSNRQYFPNIFFSMYLLESFRTTFREQQFWKHCHVEPFQFRCRKARLYMEAYKQYMCVHAQLFSHVQLLVTSWTIAHQAPLSIGPLSAISEELKSLLMKVERGEWKVGLKLNIQKTKIMASSPITS